MDYCVGLKLTRHKRERACELAQLDAKPTSIGNAEHYVLSNKGTRGGRARDGTCKRGMSRRQAAQHVRKLG